jgi:hypothetical protein
MDSPPFAQGVIVKLSLTRSPEPLLLKHNDLHLDNIGIKAERTSIRTRPKKGKAIPLQACTGPEGSRRYRLPDFKIIDT